MGKKRRRKYSSEFKARVALEAIREHQTVAELAKRYGVNSKAIYKWKAQLVERARGVFEADRSGRSGDVEREDELLKKIGELTVERDFLASGLERYQ